MDKENWDHVAEYEDMLRDWASVGYAPEDSSELELWETVS